MLKQEPLHPLAPECHLAWLIAFSSGRLDALEHPKALAEALERLNQGALQGALRLDEPREAWIAAVDRWLSGEAA